MIEILEIRNPAAFLLTDVQDLLAAAFKQDQPVAPRVFVEEVIPLLSLPELGILLGQEDHRYRALAVLMAPATRLFDGVTVYHFFNAGSIELRDNLITAVVNWTHSRGSSKLTAHNMSGRSDSAWRKVFAKAGTIRKIGTAFEIDVRDGDQ